LTEEIVSAQNISKKEKEQNHFNSKIDLASNSLILTINTAKNFAEM